MNDHLKTNESWKRQRTNDGIYSTGVRLLRPRFTDFFTDLEKKADCFAVYV